MPLGRAYKHTLDRCPASKNLCHPPPSPLIYKDSHALAPFTPTRHLQEDPPHGQERCKHSSRIPGPVPSSHYQHFQRCPFPSQPVHWSCPPELEKPGSPPRLICKARSACLGKGGNGGRERGEQKQQQNRKEKKRWRERKNPVRLACFFLLYHLFSVSRGGPQLLRHMEHQKP